MTPSSVGGAALLACHRSQGRVAPEPVGDGLTTRSPLSAVTIYREDVGEQASEAGQGTDVSSSGPGDYSYLQPLFDRAEATRPDGDYLPLEEPEVHSSLAADDAALRGWDCSTLIRGSLVAGIAHVDALGRLVSSSRSIDSFSPWTLLRAALENFATATWLLTGDRPERRGRALRLWAEDMRNRGQHEVDTAYMPAAGAKSGQERRREIHDVATTLGLGDAIRQPVATGDVIASAAAAAKMDPVAVRAAWRVGSGFAHCRHWPHLRAGLPRDALRVADGYLIAFVLDRDQHQQLSTACLQLWQFSESRYAARRQGP